MAFTKPDRYFSRLSKINIEKDIVAFGYEYILLDVDNTILTRDESIVPTDVKNWLNKAINYDLKICLVSNDWHSNVVDAASELDLPIVVRALKPLPFAFIRAMKKINAKREKTVMIGDQLMTDVFGAHFVGLRCYLLNPLVEKDLIHTLILRKFEGVFLRNYAPEC